MQEDDAIRALAALAHPLRLRVFRALVVVGQGGLTPGVMAAALDTSATTLSFHLKELIHADLVSQERDGRNLIYRAAYDRMNALITFLTDNCCAGAACAVATPDAACGC
jgi:ArsR family transcriptional regulator